MNHPDHDPERHRARGLEIDAAVRSASASRPLVGVARGIQPGDHAAIADTAELLLRALPPTERVNLIARVIDDMEV